MPEVNEVMILDLNTDREHLQMLEQVLEVYERCNDAPYTFEKYFEEIIERDYAQLV